MRAHLVRIDGAVVFEVGEPAGKLVEDDEVEELERDPPDRRVEQIERERLDGVGPFGALDPDVSRVQQPDQTDDEDRLWQQHPQRDTVLERAPPARVVQLSLVRDGRDALVPVEPLAHDFCLCPVEDPPLHGEGVGVALPCLEEDGGPDHNGHRKEWQQLCRLSLIQEPRRHPDHRTEHRRQGEPACVEACRTRKRTRATQDAGTRASKVHARVPASAPPRPLTPPWPTVGPRATGKGRLRPSRGYAAARDSRLS